MKKKKDTAAIKSYLDLLSELDNAQIDGRKLKERARENFTKVKTTKTINHINK